MTEVTVLNQPISVTVNNDQKSLTVKGGDTVVEVRAEGVQGPPGLGGNFETDLVLLYQIAKS